MVIHGVTRPRTCDCSTETVRVYQAWADSPDSSAAGSWHTVVFGTHARTTPSACVFVGEVGALPGGLPVADIPMP